MTVVDVENAGGYGEVFIVCAELGERNVAQLLGDRSFAYRKRQYLVGACGALSTMKNKLVRLLFADTDERRDLLTLLARGLSDAVEAFRAAPSVPCRNPGKLKPGFHQACKRVAKVDGVAPPPVSGVRNCPCFGYPS